MNAEETDTLIKSLCIAFEHKFEYETVSKLLQEHGSAETVVDILLNKKIEEPAKVDKIEESKPLPPAVELPLVVEAPKVEEPALNSSVFNDLSQSTIYAIKQVGKTALENPSNFGENDLKFFQERIDSLSRQLEEVTLQKNRIEEEKRSALKWCVAQVNIMKDDLKLRDEHIQSKDTQIQQLQKQLDDQKTPVEVKMEKYFVTSKAKIIEGLDSLSKQLNEIDMSHIKAEFQNDEEEWVFVNKGVKKLQVLAADLKREFMELVKPIPPFISSKLKLSHEAAEPKPDWEKQYKDEKEMWVAEKSSMESYIKELEQRLQYYEKQQDSPKEQPRMNVSPPQTNPEPPKPIVMPPTFVVPPQPQPQPVILPPNQNYVRPPFSPYAQQGPYIPYQLQPYGQQQPMPYPYNNWAPNGSYGRR